MREIIIDKLKLIPRNDPVNRCLEDSIGEIECFLDRKADAQHNDMEELNDNFLEIVGLWARG